MYNNSTTKNIFYDNLMYMQVYKMDLHFLYMNIGILPE